MKGGDISNETPPRIIVLINVVGEIESVKVKKNFLQQESKQVIKKLDLRSLSHLWNLANKYGLAVELAAFEDEGWSQEDLDKLMESLERRISNPFNYAEVYTDVDEFISLLPYRANLKGVVDIPGRVAMYGSWGLELNNL
jgi:hypothetical protein